MQGRTQQDTAGHTGYKTSVRLVIQARRLQQGIEGQHNRNQVENIANVRQWGQQGGKAKV